MNAAPDLIALGFDEKRYLEDYVIGMMLIGDARDREAVYGLLTGAEFTGPFRAELFAVMQEFDERREEWLWIDAWRAACARSGRQVALADFAALVDDVATAALLPRYAWRLRDLGFELEASALHERALLEGDPDGSDARRIAEIAALRSELRGT